MWLQFKINFLEMRKALSFFFKCHPALDQFQKCLLCPTGGRFDPLGYFRLTSGLYMCTYEHVYTVGCIYCLYSFMWALIGKFCTGGRAFYTVEVGHMRVVPLIDNWWSLSHYVVYILACIYFCMSICFLPILNPLNKLFINHAWSADSSSKSVDDAELSFAFSCLVTWALSWLMKSQQYTLYLCVHRYLRCKGMHGYLCMDVYVCLC